MSQRNQFLATALELLLAVVVPALAVYTLVVDLSMAPVVIVLAIMFIVLITVIGPLFFARDVDG